MEVRSNVRFSTAHQIESIVQTETTLVHKVGYGDSDGSRYSGQTVNQHSLVWTSSLLWKMKTWSYLTFTYNWNFDFANHIHQWTELLAERNWLDSGSSDRLWVFACILSNQRFQIHLANLGLRSECIVFYDASGLLCLRCLLRFQGINGVEFQLESLCPPRVLKKNKIISTFCDLYFIKEKSL